LERPALAHIIRELSAAVFLREIVASMNGLDDGAFARAEEIFAPLPQRTTILRNDTKGKGGNVRAAFAHLAQSGECAIFATQDCDVASFRRADLARLCYAIAEPRLGYRFAKMYYSRVTDRLYGRVSRLFLAPLLHAIVRVAGHLPLVDFLLSFRYPLAGEVAMTRELAAALPDSDGWGLEIAQLCAAFRTVEPREVCQVDGGAGYDHKHQPAATALAAMAAEIARELFAHLAAEGLAADATFRGAITSAYRREADHALHRSAALALINGLDFDEPAERAIVAAFAMELDVMH
jgi:glucosyl-3-phosphoglycerate synthase